MDGAQPASVTVSWGKARTAARLAKRVSSSINLKAGTLTFC
ncbi:hypothetical protein [Paraburkholderia nemoris]